MPIKGLTDRVQAAFPRLGKIRKGGEATRNQAGQVVRMGQDLHHFRFSSDRPEVQTAFDEAYGKEPALINVYLPYATVDDNFQCWKEAWSQGGLVHRCDGETCIIWLDTDGKYKQTPKACPGGCDEVGRLIVIIPELVRSGFVGYVVCETHGLHDLLSVQASLMAAFEARGRNPMGLRGIPFTLRRQAEKISTPAANGKRARREKWLIKLEPAAGWVQLQLQQAHNAAMGMLEAPKAGREYVDAETGEVAVLAAEPKVVVEPPEPPAEDYTSGETPPEDGEYNLPPTAPDWPDPDQPEPEVELPLSPEESQRKVVQKLVDDLGRKVDVDFRKWFATECTGGKGSWEKATVDQLLVAEDKIKALIAKKAS